MRDWNRCSAIKLSDGQQCRNRVDPAIGRCRHHLRGMVVREAPVFVVSRSVPDHDPETVYFVLGGGLVKIGRAIDVDKRFRSLECGSPVPLELARVVPGERGLECDLHRYFAAYRKHGEWFDLKAWEAIEPLSDDEVRALAASVWEDAA